jgi:hypothetical protein
VSRRNYESKDSAAEAATSKGGKDNISIYIIADSLGKIKR